MKLPKPTCYVTIRCTRAWKQMALELANADGLSLSDALRLAVQREYLRRAEAIQVARRYFNKGHSKWPIRYEGQGGAPVFSSERGDCPKEQT